jgi:hypothetical protein
VTIPQSGFDLEPQRAGLGVGRAAGVGLVIGLNVLVLVAAVWAATNPQRIADQLAVWQYTPSVTIENYALRDTLTDEGLFLFYASKPRVSPEAQFDAFCASHKEDVGVLGCYLPNDKTIHLYDVQDDRLAGLEEVVAAHEMLHAAWDRMSLSDRAELGVLLEAEAAKRTDDTALTATLAFYATAEPGERLNELHSIIGTEFGDLSPELEKHYSTYFKDRSAVVAMHVASNRVFVDQAEAVNGLVVDIDALAASIDADYAAYNSSYDQLNSEINDFNARADSGAFATQAEFDAERGSLLDRQSGLDASYTAITARVAQYNAMVAQLDALNAEGEQLNEAINITPHPSAGG